MKKNQKQGSKPQTKQAVPSATGHRLMSSASQFRTKQVRDPKKFPGAICITGHEYLSAVNTTGATVGQNLLQIPLNPLIFDNTRLQKYGQLYEKYVFRKFILHYTSADPSTATGQYIVAYDRDFADDTPAASDIGIREYFAMKGSTISNVYLSTSFRCPLEDPQDFYFTNDTGYEGRLVYQGQLYMAAVSGSAFHGSLWIEYEVELFDPALQTVSSFFPGDLVPNPSFAATGTEAYPFVDMLKYCDFGSAQPDKGSGIPKTATCNSCDWSFSCDLSGYKGVVFPPGVWEFTLQYSRKNDSSGEGWRATTPDDMFEWGSYYHAWAFPWTKLTAEHRAITDDTIFKVMEAPVLLVKYVLGSGIGDSNSSMMVRFVLSIPAAVGYIWFFAVGALTAQPITITYNEALYQVLKLTDALSSEDLKNYTKKITSQPKRLDDAYHRQYQEKLVEWKLQAEEKERLRSNLKEIEAKETSPQSPSISNKETVVLGKKK